MKTPAGVWCREDLPLILWQPRGILTETVVDEVVAYVEEQEEMAREPFNRFTDLSRLDAIDLNFNYVFNVALHRRLTYATRPKIKSAFYVTSPAAHRVSKIHSLFTDHSAIRAKLFDQRAAAADWLEVPVEALEMEPPS
ncbi:MAG: hypothetical protein ABI540_05560 [Spartobacteria bacterium]